MVSSNNDVYLSFESVKMNRNLNTRQPMERKSELSDIECGMRRRYARIIKP